MICPNCKREIDTDSNFCRFCGVEFTQEKEPVLEIYQHTTQDDSVPRRIESVKVNEPETENPKTKTRKTLIIQLIIALSVILIIGAVLVFAIAGDNSPFSGNEVITDAQGEKLKPGRGTTEMSVEDVDGTVRTITTDRELLTADEILSEYTTVMNKLKTDAPSFSVTRYQNLPTDHQNLGPLADFILPIIEKYVTSKAASEPVDYIAGNSDKLPLPDSQYGCILTDSSAIKNAYCEVLDDEEYKLVITLNDELNPPALSSGAASSQSITNSVFDTYDALNQITSVSELAFNKIDFNYTDCTVELIYNPDTNEVTSVDMTMYIDITANTLLAEIKARIVDISEYKISY